MGNGKTLRLCKTETCVFLCKAEILFVVLHYKVRPQNNFTKFFNRTARHWNCTEQGPTCIERPLTDHWETISLVLLQHSNYTANDIEWDTVIWIRFVVILRLCIFHDQGFFVFCRKSSWQRWEDWCSRWKGRGVRSWCKFMTLCDWNLLGFKLKTKTNPSNDEISEMTIQWLSLARDSWMGHKQKELILWNFAITQSLTANLYSSFRVTFPPFNM